MAHAAGGFFGFKGVWLMPFRDYVLDVDDVVYIVAGSPVVSHDVDLEEFEVPGRDETITQGSGVVRLASGTIAGELSSTVGKFVSPYDLTHHAWKTRLEHLVRRQKEYSRIWLQAPNRFYANVELGGWEDGFAVRGVAGSWDVTVPFTEKRAP